MASSRLVADGSSNNSRRVSFGDVTHHHFSMHAEQPKASPQGFAAQHLPADFVALIPRSATMDVATCCRMFLDTRLPASVSKLPCEGSQAWRVSAKLFLDCVPLDIELCIAEVSGGGSFMTMNHYSRSDVVRFKRVCKLLLESLHASGFHVLDEHGACSSPLSTQAGLVDDDFADIFDEVASEEEVSLWLERVGLALTGLESQNCDIREEAIQILARWAISSRSSHLVLAQGLSDRSEKVAKIFFAKSRKPLTTMYPMAVILRTLLCGPSAQAREVLRKSVLADKIVKYKRIISGLPPLVAAELDSVKRCLQEPMVQKPMVQKHESAEVPCLSTMSTRATKLGSSGGSMPASASSAVQIAQQHRSSPQASLDAQTTGKLRNILYVTNSLFDSMEAFDGEDGAR